jgi:hypothetical protein
VLGTCVIGAILAPAVPPQGGAAAAAASEDLTREEFRARVHALGIAGFKAEDLYAAVGRPARTQSLGGQRYWYWQCRDGTIQMLLLIGVDNRGDRIYVQKINEY